ncbi:hypothetical protein [Streptomyces sp. NPDC102462]|uniref:hypothetical protein n=1 Tax=Streptomyces sp. NPDC102462 TaxID=3366178 RepID=UPI00380CDF53
MGSGLLVTYAPQPTHLVYNVLLVVYVLQVVGVLLMAETATRTPGALRSLRVSWTVPARARGPLVRAAPVVLAVWALAGFHGSVGPALVHRQMRQNFLGMPRIRRPLPDLRPERPA